MTIEEAFKIIRNFLNDGIKHYEDIIERLEEMECDAKEKLNPITLAPRDLLFRRKSLSNINQFLQNREEAKKIIFESKEHLKTIHQNRQVFGRKHLLRKIVDFEAFFANLNYMNYILEFPFDRELIAKIIGMAIYTNNEIYDRNKKELENDLNSKHSLLRKESQLVRTLKPYFNSQGEVIANSDISEFLLDLTMLLNLNHDRTIDLDIPLDKQFSSPELIRIMTNNLLEVNKNRKVVKDKITVSPIITKKERRQLKEQQRLNEQELATYFDGEKILRACNSLEEFENLVNSCNLSEENKTKIVKKMQSFLNKNDDLRKISFLSQEEQKIYKLSLNKKLGNYQVKELIDEIDVLLEMNNTPISSKEDKEYIESEVKALIERLKFILNINTLSLQNK